MSSNAAVLLKSTPGKTPSFPEVMILNFFRGAFRELLDRNSRKALAMISVRVVPDSSATFLASIIKASGRFKVVLMCPSISILTFSGQRKDKLAA